MSYTRYVLFLLVLPLSLLWGCRQSPYPNVPSQYHALLDEALQRAGENATELRQALARVPKEQAEGLAFLIAYMPERDVTTLTADFLLENVAYAYAARERFAWGAFCVGGVYPPRTFFQRCAPLRLYERDARQLA